MSRTALVLGASGQVGAAVIPALLRDGWRVRAGARSRRSWPDAVEGVLVDREDHASLRRAVAGDTDVIVDCVAYSAAHAHQLVALAGTIGSAIVLSSVSVYADSNGRTLDEARGFDDFPEFAAPVRESQARTRPGDETYSTRKVAMEDVLLHEESALPATVLRPGAISGPGSVHPRELWFVKRALDRRPVQILNWDGRSRFHTSSTVNIAELVRLAAREPGRRVLNAVDPTAHTAAEIGSAINGTLDHHPEELLITDGSIIGDTPWSVPKPFVMDMSAAVDGLGYRPVADYFGALPSTIQWITESLRDRDWKDAFPRFLRANGPESFDYASEDAWVRSA